MSPTSPNGCQIGVVRMRVASSRKTPLTDFVEHYIKGSNTALYLPSFDCLAIWLSPHKFAGPIKRYEHKRCRRSIPTATAQDDMDLVDKEEHRADQISQMGRCGAANRKKLKPCIPKVNNVDLVAKMIPPGETITRNAGIFQQPIFRAFSTLGMRNRTQSFLIVLVMAQPCHYDRFQLLTLHGFGRYGHISDWQDTRKSAVTSCFHSSVVQTVVNNSQTVPLLAFIGFSSSYDCNQCDNLYPM
ncbi:hypothetical protein CLF_112187 [Clonorchis sinensis]|uniref:Uncharacterized protein n=1 Tax=Clonorchis sinensis TaxID=79923 RepID=G7YVY2_CLOSI|nr:hypothetical protein CLF_112187 [Clonorchis sinensis]